MAAIQITPAHSFAYPYAGAPDIIRSAEKDKYLQNILVQHISNVLRNLYGSRYVQVNASNLTTLADLLYFSATTLLGNRTLGEEYCDIVQVSSVESSSPSLVQRSGFIVTSILLPHLAGKLLPKLRNVLERRLRNRLENSTQAASTQQTIREYLLNNLETITSPSLIYGVSLAIFYFTGSYYHISKRLFGLRYIFTKANDQTNDQISYEVLGALLSIQMAVQAWIHIRTTMATNEDPKSHKIEATTAETLVAVTHTPKLTAPRYVLTSDDTFGWIEGEQQRKCTLCLEEMKDPSATTCGHVFCWECITDWIREKPECPLCRQSIQSQHVLPLRG